MRTSVPAEQVEDAAPGARLYWKPLSAFLEEDHRSMTRGPGVGPVYSRT